MKLWKLQNIYNFSLSNRECLSKPMMSADVWFMFTSVFNNKKYDDIWDTIDYLTEHGLLVLTHDFEGGMGHSSGYDWMRTRKVITES